MIDWGCVPKEDLEKVAFLNQVGSVPPHEFKSRLLGCAPIKSEGSVIRTADFYGVDPNGYDLFSSDEERVSMLAKYGIK